MIKNERQYKITRAQAERFDKTLTSLLGRATEIGVHPILHKAQQDAIRSQLADLRAELAEYESLRAGERHVLECDGLIELPRALIKARIAANISQKDLAARLGLKEQQIQQYEATEYSSASFSRVQEVVAALGVHVREKVVLPRAPKPVARKRP